MQDRIGHLQRLPLFPAEAAARNATVCVTGATGYVAGTLVERLLLAGAIVHATARDPARGAAHLWVGHQCMQMKNRQV